MIIRERGKIMNYKIKGYEPEKLFNFFEEISAIPRGSSNEKEISDYIVNFAKKRNLWVYQDELYNVIIKKEASKEAKNKKPIMLQGHLDMVCEKLSDSNHDFTKDGIDLIVKDGILTANKTTLGGDNGAAVALMLAILDDESISHPKLECVFTTQEETGLGGAHFLDKSLIDARTMINLDSEEEGIATVSCAGGMRFSLIKSIQKEKKDGVALSISIDGLLGGHSGMDINQERQNANILLARLLNQAIVDSDAYLSEFNGGSKDNAIPRSSSAVLLFENEEEAKTAEDKLKNTAEELKKEIIPFEKDFVISIKSEKACLNVMNKKDSKDLISAVYMAPNGVLNRNLKQDGFVVTSSNLGVVKTEDEEIRIVFAPRSSVKSLQEDTTARLTLLGETFGFKCEIAGEYPGWSFAEHSPIRDIFIESYKNLFNDDLKIEAIHAGLECGLFSDAIEGLDAIAVGPTIKGCHTPDEYIPLDSFERFYTLLCDVLKREALDK